MSDSAASSRFFGRPFAAVNSGDQVVTLSYQAVKDGSKARAGGGGDVLQELEAVRKKHRIFGVF